MTFTYETQDNKECYETFEWDNTWIDYANDDVTPRVLYIGDSISYGSRSQVAAEMGKEALIDVYSTSKGIDNVYFQDCIKNFARQEKKRACILFNNGLHGWHLDDETEYGEAYEKMVQFLLKEFPETPILLLLTTYNTEARIERVHQRNAAVCKIAEKYGLQVVDLYAVSAAMPELLQKDGVHFQREGYEALGKAIADALRQILAK